MARHKLTPAERADRRERRDQAREKSAGRRQLLREWFDARRAAADKRREEARKAPRPASGVDRVPARLHIEPRPVEYIVEHHDMPRAERRARGYRVTSGNVPHRNADRDRRPGARLRAGGPTTPGRLTVAPERARLRELRTERLDEAVHRALAGKEFVTEEGKRLAVASVRRWTR